MLYLNSIGETFSDFPDPNSLAVIVSFYGCTFNCKGCQNPGLQEKDPECAVSWFNVFNDIKNYCARCNTKKVVLSGGDPFCRDIKEDLNDMLLLVSTLQTNGYTVCVYTGSTIEAVEEIYKDATTINYIPDYGYTKDGGRIPLSFNECVFTPTPPRYIKCGTYREDLRDKDMGKTDLKFTLASKNQAFYESFRTDDGNYAFKKISQDNALIF